MRVCTLLVENSDGFLNMLRVEVSDWRRLEQDVQSHGLLGQTWRRRQSGHIEGEVDDYAVGHNDLLGCSFLFNQFTCSTATTLERARRWQEAWRLGCYALPIACGCLVSCLALWSVPVSCLLVVEPVVQCVYRYASLGFCLHSWCLMRPCSAPLM
jgi:hypothetical protein